MSSHVQQGESLSKLKKGYKPVLVKRGNISCEYGCIGNFRSEWDRQQHMIYAHEVDGEATTLRVINEAVRNIGRNTPLDTYSISTPPKKEAAGDWTFVPRGSQSVRHNPQHHSDNRSTKTSASGWRTGISRVISFNRKSEQTTGRSVRSKTISNPIPHQSSLDAAERIGTDVALVHRPRNPVDSMATSNSNAYSSGSSGIGRPGTGAVQDNPVALEAKDFDCSSDDDRDSSPPSSPSPAPATPLDMHSSFTADDFTKKLNNVHPNFHHHHHHQHSPQTTPPNNARPPMPQRSPASFSRPTPAAYPLLLRTNLDRQPSLTSIRSPVSLRSPTLSVPTSPTTKAPTRPARPPVPTRNPARPLRASASSEDAHGRPTFTPNSVPLVRRSPSHGVLRI